jgi:hypothetical protein
MKKAVQVAWVKALRSGKFEQGRDMLCQVHEGRREFCCLGVLCTLAEEAGVTVGTETEYHDGTLVKWGGEEKVLPQSVIDWAGMSSGVGKRHGGAEISLAMMNDQGEKFAHLADTIEEEGHVL